MSDGWTTIPRWLYQSDLPDERLQEVYVREARKKADELAQRLRDLDDERLSVAGALCQALEFVAEAEEALGRYRQQRGRATISEVPPALPKPRRRGPPRG